MDFRSTSTAPFLDFLVGYSSSISAVLFDGFSLQSADLPVYFSTSTITFYSFLRSIVGSVTSRLPGPSETVFSTPMVFLMTPPPVRPTLTAPTPVSSTLLVMLATSLTISTTSMAPLVLSTGGLGPSTESQAPFAMISAFRGP